MDPFNILLGQLHHHLASFPNFIQQNTLQSIPVELRKQIFAYLLINPELGEASSISQRQTYGTTAEYDLSRALLLVCKQFHEEAMVVLYGSNTFIIEFSPELIQDSLDIQLPRTACSPITRWQNQISDDVHMEPAIGQSLLPGVPALRHVRKWRVVLSAQNQVDVGDNQSRAKVEFIWFCRLLCEFQTHMKQVRELEIVIIPKGVENGTSYLEVKEMRKKLLFPLELLRNVLKFTIRTANIAEIPDFACGDEWNISPLVTQSILPVKSHRRYLMNLIQGSSDVELCTKMFAALKNYAQAFERDVDFKEDMGLSTGDFVLKSSAEMMKLSENPFWSHTFHPQGWVHTVEFSLARAKSRADSQYRDMTNTRQFKLERSKVIQYLERQYRRIKTASDELVEFVKMQKQKHGIFSPLYSNGLIPVDLIYSTEALVLLEEYAESFTRELDPSTKRAIRLRGDAFKIRYEFLDREIAIKKCGVAFQQRDGSRFKAEFILAVKDMDRQYREILEARQKIYEWDLDTTIRDIEIKPLPSLEDWIIDWKALEPTVTAMTESEADMSTQMLHTILGSGLQLGDLEVANAIPENILNLPNEDDVVSEHELGDVQLDDPDTKGWSLLPFHEDDEFYLLTYQMDGEQSELDFTPDAHAVIDDNSEYDYYEKVFREDTDDESLYSHSEDEEDVGTEMMKFTYDHINTGGSIFHVLPWLANSNSSLSHVFPWLTVSQ
ncbi:hypothetical protein NHQ30_005470 [Ciborinia camelliae]|nr:hypothetical protein NHQ30_005470 [Ciborinia camelliae]